MSCASSVLIKVLLLVIFKIVASDDLDEPEQIIRVCLPQETCVEVSSCNTLNYNFTSLSVRDQSLFLIHKCSNETVSTVCCSEYAAETDAPNSQNCGMNPHYPKITGGVDAELDDYPWMALLEYRNTTTSNISYHCAGTLINNRYVLTAAHCLSHRDELTSVLLGKYDTRSHENCVSEDECAHPTVKVGIEEKFIHEDYNGMINDIALIRLSNVVYYTDYIRPICLPSMLGLVASNKSTTQEIGGWGKGAKTSVKQKLYLPAYDFQRCAETYRRHSNIRLVETQLCAGAIRNESACAGDSGGALMTKVNRQYAIEGIIISGHNVCDLKSDTVYPIIFTRVYSFEDWIASKIRP